jgi:hypothetical protein
MPVVSKYRCIEKKGEVTKAENIKADLQRRIKPTAGGAEKNLDFFLADHLIVLFIKKKHMRANLFPGRIFYGR